jgi:hypothetical protein
MCAVDGTIFVICVGAISGTFAGILCLHATFAGFQPTRLSNQIDQFLLDVI